MGVGEGDRLCEVTILKSKAWIKIHIWLNELNRYWQCRNTNIKKCTRKHTTALNSLEVKIKSTLRFLYEPIKKTKNNK